MVKFIEQYYDTQRVISIIDEDYMQAYITMNEVRRNEYGGMEFEVSDDGTMTPLVSNPITVGKWDLVFTSKPKSHSMSTERLRQNVELMKVLQSTNPELVKYIVPDIMKDMDSPSAKKVRDVITQMDQAAASGQSDETARLEADNRRLELMLKQSQANLNNTKAQTMIERNRIDLQKAFSRALIDKATVQAKNDKNQLDAMRRIY